VLGNEACVSFRLSGPLCSAEGDLDCLGLDLDKTPNIRPQVFITPGPLSSIFFMPSLLPP